MAKSLFIFIGASGSGKTTIGEFLKSQGIAQIVSTTTRHKRECEVEGVDYYFVSKEEFEKIEKIEESTYSGNHYCISRKEVISKIGKCEKLFAILDLHGTLCIKEEFPEYTKIVYVHVPESEMYARMKKRGDAEENIRERLENARLNGELENYKHADYVVNNINLQDTLTEVWEIVTS